MDFDRILPTRNGSKSLSPAVAPATRGKPTTTIRTPKAVQD